MKHINQNYDQITKNKEYRKWKVYHLGIPIKELFYSIEERKLGLRGGWKYFQNWVRKLNNEKIRDGYAG